MMINREMENNPLQVLYRNSILSYMSAKKISYYKISYIYMNYEARLYIVRYTYIIYIYTSIVCYGLDSMIILTDRSCRSNNLCT